MEPFEIKLAGPGKNALGSQMMKWIVEQLEDADGRPVLLTGEGNAFSAGLNLKEVADLDGEGMVKFLTVLDEMAVSLYAYPGVTVAHVNGHAIAGGAVLALCCDYRVADANPGARIGLNEVALGLPFPPAILRIVQERIPARYREEVLLGAGLVSPDRACELGLIDAVCEDAATAARERLEAWGGHPRYAYGEVKRTLRRGPLGVSADDRKRFHDESLAAWVSPELKAKIAALLGR